MKKLFISVIMGLWVCGALGMELKDKNSVSSQEADIKGQEISLMRAVIALPLELQKDIFDQIGIDSDPLDLVFSKPINRKTMGYATSSPCVVAISPDSSVLAIGFNFGQVSVYDMNKQRFGAMYRSEDHKRPRCMLTSAVYELAISADNRYIVAAHEDDVVNIWKNQGAQKEPLVSFQADYHVASIVIDQEHCFVAVQLEDTSVMFYDFNTGKKLSGRLCSWDAVSFPSSFNPVSFDSRFKLRIVYGSISDAPTQIMVENAQTGEKLSILDDQSNASIISVVISPDMRYIISGSDSAVTIWDISRYGMAQEKLIVMKALQPVNEEQEQYADLREYFLNKVHAAHKNGKKLVIDSNGPKNNKGEYRGGFLWNIYHRCLTPDARELLAPYIVEKV